MTPDFFIRLTLAACRVADILPKSEVFGEQIRACAGKLLSDLLLLLRESSVGTEQRRQTASKAIKEVGELLAYFNYARRMSQVNPENFRVLEQEYGKVGEFLRKLHKELEAQISEHVPSTKPAPAVRNPSPNASASKGEPSAKTNLVLGKLSSRQTRILELMRNKDRMQVWELQRVLPEVTKRTLRRDLDSLLQRNLILRQGQWNEVFYQIC